MEMRSIIHRDATTMRSILRSGAERRYAVALEKKERSGTAASEP